MGRRIIFLLITLLINSIVHFVYASSESLKANIIQQRLNQLTTLLNTSKWTSHPVNQINLPEPYDYLLTQQLLTPAIENYYKRTAIIRVIHTHQNSNEHTYSRVISMLLDPVKERDDAKLAQNMKEDLIVELAFITIFYRELPQQFIRDIIHSNIPFGTLLKKNHINTYSTNRYYFSTSCNSELVQHIKCRLNTTLYGRVNTIVKGDNKQQIAQVVELLSGLKCNNPGCDLISTG
ncbi:hypothetical protein [Legionella quateirensis]|uniref:Uncharacterized protein n=1 Tax=Legionella quateirensis TaxID=45072 RepID=A0A378KT96_9GAMM|nr:hypothetical protein [Legionella quateirensis]KTD50982.1 hypothetical protein Lqua_1209 [Legionella quateirensis]STY17772.1 Uncharacterised protein [Legionella quateirensis]